MAGRENREKCKGAYGVVGASQKKKKKKNYPPGTSEFRWFGNRLLAFQPPS